MSGAPVIDASTAALRRAFDQQFKTPPADATDELEEFLKIRVAGDPYAIRLRDITGIVEGRKVVPVPAAALDLLGLAGIRGDVVPVFGLASLLGYDQPAGAPPWMLLCGAEDPVALAFSDLEGVVRLSRSSLHVGGGPEASRQHVDQIASTDDGARAVLNIPGVLATIRGRSGPHRAARER